MDIEGSVMRYVKGKAMRVLVADGDISAVVNVLTSTDAQEVVPPRTCSP